MPISGKINFAIEPKSNIYYPICFNNFDRYFFYIKQRKIYRSLISLVNPSEYDKIHAHTLFTDGNIALKMKEKYEIPYIVSVRNTDLNLFFKKRRYLRKKGINILLNSSKIIFISTPCMEELIENYIPVKYQNQVKSKSTVIPNGIDNFWLENKASERTLKDKNTIKVIYTGRINKGKNIETSLEAIKQLREKGINATFTVVGKIEDLSVYEKLKNYKFVSYMHPQAKQDLLNTYRNHDIFLMPSYYETFGLVYAEAMSQGLPIIYTKGQGFDKQFAEGTVGYHVSPTDPNEICNTVIKIINTYDSISENCISLVDKFKWSSLSKIYKEIYEGVK
ncbi:glycosyltransferase family 4 protein [Neobacillus sp. PS2-9]|uniref:glycosyltransferase family 4 protein n=1 Tax=Neobacillus sp. PS2-9 TaxID=3070676 RepID=UPI0027DF478B|nr:glycosyltransferase family 4 protein [Neobacillus sp. PS2-9]WML60652.1 glycosyltransferase family 4 protein [Neobacillus sp. PS2-9]